MYGFFFAFPRFVNNQETKYFSHIRQNNICNTRLYSKETTKCNASVICMITCRVSYVRIRRYL